MVKSRKIPRCSDIYKTEDVKIQKLHAWNNYMTIITKNNTKPLPKDAYKHWEKDFKKGFMFGCKDIKKTKNLNKTIKNVKKKFKF
jgi:hypothetical protein